MVRGGYTPQRIEPVAGMPLQIAFDRPESEDCTSRVVFPDLGITRLLPANERTTSSSSRGREGFGGSLRDEQGARLAVTVTPGNSNEQALALDVTEPMDAAATDAQQAAETRAEIDNVSRRVILGAVLTAPVLFAVDGARDLRCRLDAGAAAQRLVAAGRITPGDGVHRVTGAPNRLARAATSSRRLNPQIPEGGTLR